MRVLLSAYFCEPGKGSEEGIGWEVLRQVAQAHEVWVLTPPWKRELLERTSRTALPSSVRFEYVTVPLWTKPPTRRMKGEIYHYLWQIAAYCVAKRLHRAIKFHLVHHITMGRYWNPSFLALLPVPFIWGPVGGGESAPRSFWRTFRLRGKLHELGRDLARRIGECDPFLRQTAKRAAIGLAATEETAQRMRHLGCKKAIVMSAMGLGQVDLQQLLSVPFRLRTQFRLISVGRLLHWKGFHLSLRAFAQFHREFPDSEYWIVGGGSEKPHLQRITDELGISDAVTFWGATDRATALEMLTNSDALIHPSLHESGGWVCVEAMAAGRPVICLDLGGPALLVAPDSGIAVHAGSPYSTIRHLAAAIAQLANDSELRYQMGVAGRRRVLNTCAWNKKIAFMLDEYTLTANPGVPSLNVRT